MTNEAVIDFRDDLLVKGSCAIVAYACRENGNRPAKDFIEKLESSDQAKLAKSFHCIANTGIIHNTQRFRKLGGKSGKIYEFKVHPKVRVLCFQVGRTWLLTHGFNNETDKTPPRQIERAEEIMKEHILLLRQ
jgi:phage-related protein